MLAAAFPVAYLAHKLTFSNVGSTLAFLIGFAVVGFVVARRQPRNPVGWLLLAFALLLLADDDGGSWAELAYKFHDHLPLSGLGVFLQLSWAPAIVLLPLAILLFPDGRLPSWRWRAPLLLYLGGGAFYLAVLYAIAADTLLHHAVRFTHTNSDLYAVDHPAGRWAWFSTAEAVLLPLLGIAWLSFVVRQVVEYRRSTGVHRQQLKWLMAGAAVCLAAGLFIFLGATFDPNPSPGVNALAGIVSFGILALPTAIGVGILRYRLYEIDRLISRTLSYTIVTGTLVGVFVGLVLLTTRVLPFSSPVGVAASTLAAAALFNPLRRRVQRLVDRRFNRARYDAEATVASFSARLRDAVQVDVVRDDLLGVVAHALEPAHLSLWIRSET
jgi:hypothetical protein